MCAPPLHPGPLCTCKAVSWPPLPPNAEEEAILTSEGRPPACLLCVCVGGAGARGALARRGEAAYNTEAHHRRGERPTGGRSDRAGERAVLLSGAVSCGGCSGWDLHVSRVVWFAKIMREKHLRGSGCRSGTPSRLTPRSTRCWRTTSVARCASSRWTTSSGGG
eukprot:COSAG01_NODE_22258_length_864_cov_0.858824_2_plen_164_part_00